MKRSKRITLNIDYKHFIVYLLYSNEELVYIGKTAKPIDTRIRYHLNNSGKIFDSYEIIECSSEQEMNNLEAKLIFEHIPKYNKQLPLIPSQNIICMGCIKEYKNINKKLGSEGIILNGLVYIKIT